MSNLIAIMYIGEVAPPKLKGKQQQQRYFIIIYFLFLLTHYGRSRRALGLGWNLRSLRRRF